MWACLLIVHIWIHTHSHNERCNHRRRRRLRLSIRSIKSPFSLTSDKILPTFTRYVHVSHSFGKSKIKFYFSFCLLCVSLLFRISGNGKEKMNQIRCCLVFIFLRNAQNVFIHYQISVKMTWKPTNKPEKENLHWLEKLESGQCLFIKWASN